MSSSGGNKLSIKLNLKPKQITKAFTDEDDHDEINPPLLSTSKPKTTTNLNVNFLAQQAKNTSDKATAQIHEKALEQDRHVFEYDKVYEAMKAHTAPTSTKSKLSSSEPRYVDQLLKSAQVRKLTYLKSQINKFKLDAQANAQQGEQDEEAFVTSSYKTALQEIKAMETELEDQSQGIQGTAGMHSMYRTLLNQSDSQARQALEPIQSTTSPSPVESVPDTVSVNDSGEVVDKRTLLIKNGLTLRSKPSLPNPTAVRMEKVARVDKRSGDRELDDQRPIKVVKKDEAVISSARERYLARKLAASSSDNNNNNDAGS